MPNRKYEKGARNERDLLKQLKKSTLFYYGTRSAGSHSAFDVIAIIGEMLYLIQVKGKNTKLKAVDMPDVLYVNQMCAWKEKGKWNSRRLK